jgi:Mn-dependent DtxR family transcriptional regulator
MQPSLREDYLEAIQQFTEKNTHPPRYEELAAKIGKPEKVIRTDMEDLVSSGDVLL